MSFFALIRGGNRLPLAKRKPMDGQIIATYCLCDDLLHATHPQEDPPCQMSDAEGLPTALTAACFCRGNRTRARWLLQQQASMPQRLSKRRLRRRLYRRTVSVMRLFTLMRT